MRLIGLGLTTLALLAPLVWFVPLARGHDSLALFSQYMGSVALIAMGITQLFATRMRWLESVFGGLDRIYVLHKWLGIGSMIAVLLHDTIDADMDGLGRETWLTELAETLGEISLYGLLILVVITITTFIPYHLWRWTHKLMGAFFALSAFHFLFIMKPFSNFDPLGLYVGWFCALGILCYLYTLLPETWLRARHHYKVQSVKSTGDAVAITLAPGKRGISHRAGQFAFVNFAEPGLAESHPFTISQAPNDNGTLRITAKPMGDYTTHMMRALKPGMTARVQGPFGHFKQPKRGATQIWIAGGIGVTPFAAWISDMRAREANSSTPVHMFYCVKSKASAAHLDELEAAAGSLSNFNLHIIESAQKQRLTANFIEKTIGGDLSKATAAFCGPAPMRKSLKADLVKHGLPARSFAYEEFEIRSGIGFRLALSWVQSFILPALSNKTWVSSRR